MRKILVGLSVGVALLLGTVSAFAADGLGFGLTVSGVGISGSGTETEGGETNNGSSTNRLAIGSIFAEYTKGWFTLGLDYIPWDADISSKTKTRGDVETSVGTTNTHTSTSRTQSAQAEIANHATAYVEVGSAVYVKAGVVQMTVNTQETLGTGSTYGNAEDVNGTLLGLGIKGDWGNNMFYKLEGTYTDYDNISITSGVARGGVSPNNKISADLDATQAKLAIGIRF